MVLATVRLFYLRVILYLDLQTEEFEFVFDFWILLLQDHPKIMHLYHLGYSFLCGAYISSPNLMVSARIL